MGFIRGMGSGLSGVILRPVGGVLQFVSIETETASRALRGGEGQESTVQVRPRRALRKGAVCTACRTLGPAKQSAKAHANR